MSAVPDPLAPDDPAVVVVGLHHIRIPVSDPWVSRDWYMTVLGFRPLLHLEEEQGVIGVVLHHPRDFMVGLHRDPHRAEVLQGFALLGLTVANTEELQRWATRLHDMAIPYHPIEEGHLGWYLDLPDPDGILVRFHTGTGPDAEEA
jgi:catechol 2,3-dioxygenase-like lactoylglutathione lyase family enzyme